MRERKNKTLNKTTDRNTEKKKYKHRLEERCSNCSRHIEGWWEKEYTPNLFCCSTSWLNGRIRRGWIHKMLLFIGKLALEIRIFFCSHKVVPAHITHIPTSSAAQLGEFSSVIFFFFILFSLFHLYLTYMQPTFLWRWLQSSFTMSASVAVVGCRPGEEVTHYLCRRVWTLPAAMVLP